MSAEPRGSMEHFPAHAALERLDATVFANVEKIFGFGAEPLQANATHKMTTVVVTPLVFVKIESVNKRQSALVAHVRFLPSVLPLVTFQVKAESKRLVAARTLEGFRADVFEAVAVEFDAAAKRLFAVGAGDQERVGVEGRMRRAGGFLVAVLLLERSLVGVLVGR